MAHSGGASNIVAGGAAVEIGGDDSPLEQSLNHASKMLEEWGKKTAEKFKGAGEALKEFGEGIKKAGEGIAHFGEKMVLAGEAALLPFELGIHKLAEYGHELEKLTSRTGMGSGPAAGLILAGKESGVAANAITGAVTKMQRNIASGSKSTAAALGEIGLTLADMRGKKPEEQFAILSDRIGGMADEGKRADVIMQLFGRAGMQLTPIFEKGGEALKYYQERAEILGLALGGDALQNAKELHESIENLKGAFEGLLMALAGAIVGDVKKLGSSLLDVVVAARKWIETHGPAVAAFARMAAAVLLAGTVITGIGMAILFVGNVITAVGTIVSTFGAILNAAFAPEVAIILAVVAAVVGIGLAVLAVLDCLGVTKSGFGDLFNSIRIDGTGLGTILTGMWDEFQKACVWALARVTDIWEGFGQLIHEVFYDVLDAVLLVPQKILEAFAYMEGKVRDGLAWLADAANEILPKSMKIDTSHLKNENVYGGAASWIQGKRDEIAASQSQNDQKYLADKAQRDNVEAGWYKRYDKQTDDALAKDPRDENAGILGFRGDLAKKGLGEIGANITEALKGILPSFDISELLKSLNIEHVEMPKAPEAPEMPEMPSAPDLNVAGMSTDAAHQPGSVGSFSSYAAGSMTASGFTEQIAIARQQLDAQREIAANTRDGGGLGT